jgi:ABC-type lipoprotein release transport system permease subunit
VRVLPRALGAFLVLLALGTVGHALATAVRRRHDVAVLRALGMTRRQSQGVVVTQASVLAVAGLLFGIGRSCRCAGAPGIWDGVAVPAD